MAAAARAGRAVASRNQPAAAADAGDQPPGSADDVDDGEGDRQADRPEDEEEEDEGEDRQRDQEEFHARVVLQRRWARRQQSSR